MSAIVCKDTFSVCIFSGLDTTGPPGESGAKGEKGAGGDPNNQPGVLGTAGSKGLQGPQGKPLFLCINETSKKLAELSIKCCIVTDLYVLNGVLRSV